MKSTFILQQFLPQLEKSFLYYDLLDDSVEERLSRNPQLLALNLDGAKEQTAWVIIDEIQKIPRLLDVVHLLTEKKKVKFILSGSSARKLKNEGANLLAARAFEYRLFPLTFLELGHKFRLQEVLNFGALPSVFNFENTSDKIKYLKT